MATRLPILLIVFMIGIVPRSSLSVNNPKTNSLMPWQVEQPNPLRDNGGYSVVITGGTRGVGLAMAKEFLSRGDSVVICGRDQERLSKAIGMLETKYPSTGSRKNIFGISADISSYEDVVKLGIMFIDRAVEFCSVRATFETSSFNFQF